VARCSSTASQARASRQSRITVCGETIAVDGAVKVLDFGLAKLTQRDGDAAGADATASPTITAPHLVTGAGVGFALGQGEKLIGHFARGAEL
jgi:hypothetical protein